MTAATSKVIRGGKQVSLKSEELVPGDVVVLEAGDAVPAAFRSAAGSIGLRMPDNDTALELIAAVGCPLATTSANISGLQAPGSFDALDPRLAARVGVVMADDRDGDNSGIASTVVDCTVDPPRIVRAGAVTEAHIRALA